MIDAIKKYLQFKASAGQRLGPFLLLNEDERLGLNEFRPLIDQVVKSIIRKEGTGLNLKAPSVFHAVAFLQQLQQQCIFTNVPSQIDSLPGPLLFRGIKNAEYELESTLYRYNEPKEKGVVKSTAFARLMKELGDATIETNIPLSNYMAVSQHYGFPTNLIDFTPDPGVAAFFSVLNGENDKTAVIYFAPFKILAKKGTRCILPPPLFERIFLQRGVFIESETPLEKEWFHSISFPANTIFSVYRENGECELLPKFAWIHQAKEFIDSTSLEVLSASDKLHELMFQKTKSKWEEYPSVVKELELAKWLDFYEDMCYWLAYVMDHHGEYTTDNLAVLKRDNPELVQIHAELLKGLRGQ